MFTLVVKLLYLSSPGYETVAVVFCVSPGMLIVACPFLIGAVYVLPFAVAVMFPVAFARLETLIIASSPAVIGSAVMLAFKSSFGGTGAGLTVMFTLVVALLYLSSPG